MILKKNGKRSVRDYCKYDNTNLQYYGLLYKNGRARVDVKRFIQTIRVEPKIVEAMNRPRKTAYFVPAKKSSSEYMTNLFRSAINSQKNYWNDEIKNVINKILTPQEAADEARTGYYMQTGILDHDECQMHGFISGWQREIEYNRIIYYLVAQFIHQLASYISSISLKVLVLNGYNRKDFTKQLFDAFIQGYTKKGVTLESITGYETYDKLYLLWNFLKHNSLSTYEKLRSKYPDIVSSSKEYQHGDIALNYVILSKELIDGLLDGLLKYFENLCSAVFGEDPFEAGWNSDDSVRSMVVQQIKLVTIQIGLPLCI